MKRTIVQPADLSGAALAELKQWLGISSNAEDAALTGLLHASLELCESFTGQMTIEQACEEQLPITRNWIAIQATPVRAITSLELVAEDGTRSALPASDFELEIDAEGIGKVRQTASLSGRTVAVSFVAGIAVDWASLPDALRHGVIRLAAHDYRDRDASEPLSPPASVAALWRPWKKLRLA